MYLAHFGLTQLPFGMTPDPGFFFAGSKRGEILETLIYTIVNGEGIVKVTGEVGSGKTMLCRMLESRLPEHVEVIYLVNPTLTRVEVNYAIASELGLPVSGKRVDEVMRMLHAELIGKHIAGKRVVLLIEEAQAMSLETLEEIRLISNLETAHHKLLHIVLFGQPELDEHLKLAKMRQFKERITQSFNVPPLASATVSEFLMFRLRTAGYRGPDIFSNEAINLIGRVSEGILRRISILADKSLLAAYADNSYSIKPKHVKAAVKDSEFPKSILRMMNRKILAGTLVFLSLLSLGCGWHLMQMKSSVSAPPAISSASITPAVVDGATSDESTAPPVSLDNQAAASAHLPLLLTVSPTLTMQQN